MRHELKYFVNKGDDAYLAGILKHVLKRDSHAGPGGVYMIRSLYFDDAENSALFEKIAGVERRDKYRIRIYDYSDRRIQLERKSKRGDYISKTSVLIDRALAEQIIAGDPTGLAEIGHPLLQDVALRMVNNRLRPAVIVDYVREPFIHPAENTRITFDRQLRTGVMRTSIFDPDTPTVPVLDDQTSILEVKFDSVIPDMLTPILSGIRAQRSAISKYTLCRRYEFDI
jgi:SPX domain protein involved in polyphosphate accumulation